MRCRVVESKANGKVNFGLPKWLFTGLRIYDSDVPKTSPAYDFFDIGNTESIIPRPLFPGEYASELKSDPKKPLQATEPKDNDSDFSFGEDDKEMGDKQASSEKKAETAASFKYKETHYFLK